MRTTVRLRDESIRRPHTANMHSPERVKHVRFAEEPMGSHCGHYRTPAKIRTAEATKHQNFEDLPFAIEPSPAGERVGAPPAMRSHIFFADTTSQQREFQLLRNSIKKKVADKVAMATTDIISAAHKDTNAGPSCRAKGMSARLSRRSLWPLKRFFRRLLGRT